MKCRRSHMSHNSATTYREVFKRFLKISLWSTYFVYVRTSKTRGFPEVFQRFLVLGFWSTFFVYFPLPKNGISRYFGSCFLIKISFIVTKTRNIMENIFRVQAIPCIIGDAKYEFLETKKQLFCFWKLECEYSTRHL